MLVSLNITRFDFRLKKSLTDIFIFSKMHTYNPHMPFMCSRSSKPVLVLLKFSLILVQNMSRLKTSTPTLFPVHKSNMKKGEDLTISNISKNFPNHTFLFYHTK